MQIEFSQKIGQTTIRMSIGGTYHNLIVKTGEPSWEEYQKASEFWQAIVEYEIGLLPESEQPGSSFKKLR